MATNLLSRRDQKEENAKTLNGAAHIKSSFTNTLLIDRYCRKCYLMGSAGGLAQRVKVLLLLHNSRNSPGNMEHGLKTVEAYVMTRRRPRLVIRALQAAGRSKS